MADSLSRLGRRMADAAQNQDAGQSWANFSAVEALHVLEERLRWRVNAPPPPPGSAIAAALESWRLYGRAPADLVAWGVTLHQGSNPALLAAPTALSAWLQAAREGLSAYGWRGLVEAWLRWPVETQGGRRLQAFLSAHFSALHASARPVLPWMSALAEHPELFERARPTFSTDRSLSHDLADFEKLEMDLQPPAGSWLRCRLILGQMERIAGWADAHFRAAIPRLLSRVEENADCREQGLTQLFDRYARCVERPRQPELQRQALAVWGDPRGEGGDWRGSLVCRRLLLSWLAEEGLRAFFSGAEEGRRRDFWLRYAHCMIRVYPVASPGLAAATPGILRLGADGGPPVKALLMLVEDFVFVEFSGPGHACYGYAADNLPFRLRDGIAADDLRKKLRSVFYGIHRGGWEDDFARRLESLGVGPA